MLSIIIPTFEEDRVLEGTLRHIRTLTSVPYELIVADSGSTDKTVEIAQSYADRVVRYDNELKNAARGRNSGALAAQGDLLAFIDADVTVADINTFFLQATEAFTRDPDLVAVGVRVRTLPEVETWGDRISHHIINTLTFVSNNILHMGTISGEFQMMRASTFGNVGGYNEELYVDEDNDLYARLAKVGKVRQLRSLWVLHPSRRAHAIGWKRLWWEWCVNFVYVKWLGRPYHSEWIHIR